MLYQNKIYQLQRETEAMGRKETGRKEQSKTCENLDNSGEYEQRDTSEPEKENLERAVLLNQRENSWRQSMGQKFRKLKDDEEQNQKLNSIIRRK